MTYHLCYMKREKASEKTTIKGFAKHANAIINIFAVLPRPRDTYSMNPLVTKNMLLGNHECNILT